MMDSRLNESDLGERLTLVCGSDTPLMTSNTTNDQLLPIFIERLKSAVLKNSLRMRALCFSPAPYGSEPTVQSVEHSPLAHHTLPGPAIPIPRGADFLGLHVSKVEADVHVPLPDANRTFQLRQSIRGLQRSGTPLMLLALHPGVIGYHVRREGLKRRVRGRAIPLVAVHWRQYHRFCQLRVAEIIEAVLRKHGASLYEAWVGDAGAALSTAINSDTDLGPALERLVACMGQVLHHWYIQPGQRQLNVSWGRFWLWLANTCSSHAHHRLQGSLAAAGCLQELIQIVELVIGVPIVDLIKRPLDSRRLIPQAAADSVGHFVQRYQHWFYKDCDRVINLEGAEGHAELLATGIRPETIFDFDWHGDLALQMQHLYSDIVQRSKTQIAPQRCKLSEFRWGPSVAGQASAAHLAISDVHLGDGSGTERAQATYALRTHCQLLGVQSMDIVGDLIQRDVPTDLAEKHRHSFLRALRHVTGTITSDHSALRLQVTLEREASIQPKRLTEVLRELQNCAIKLGVVINCQDFELGVPDGAFGRPIGVFLERGNHDEGENLEEVIPGADVTKSMIRHDADAGILFCHGNIWNLPEVAHAFTQSSSFSELADNLTESRLRASLETAQVIYSLTSALWRASAKRIDVRGIWKKDLQPALSRLVQWHRDRDRQGQSVASEFSQFMQGVISPVDNAQVAAQAGSLTQGFGKFCWAVCDGHSHRPAIEFTECQHPVTGRKSGVLLVNCGKFHGKNITAVFMKFPEALLVEWDERDQCYYVLQHYRLTNEQIAQVIGSVPPVTGRTDRSSRAVEPLTVASQPENAEQDSCTDANILLEVCSEGGGHAERQLAFLPLYRAQGSVRVAASGRRSLPWADEHWPGHRIVYDQSGRVRSASTLLAYFDRRGSIKQNARRLVETLGTYTHAITDFAPNLPMALQYARKLKCKDLPTLFHLSHHAALHSQFVNTPRPLNMDRIEYWATQRYLDSIVGDMNIGFHFERYHPEILTPPLLPEIFEARPSFDSPVILVYLTGHPDHIAAQCAQIDPQGDHEWHIYTSQVRSSQRSTWPHIWLFPVDKSYRTKMFQARAVVLSSGFMGPAELIHLGKPFIAVCTPGHGEHAFNSAALSEISDIPIIAAMDDENSQAIVRETLGEAKSVTAPLRRWGRMGPVGPYSDVRSEVMFRIFGTRSFQTKNATTNPETNMIQSVDVARNF